MNRLISLVLAFVLLSAATTAIFAQGADKREPRMIEVTGSAETLVTPNEFTFKITLRERLENKQKVTIEQQENALKAGLAGIGIDVVKDLTVYDLRSNYVPVRKRNKDVLSTKDYRLKVYDLAKIDRLQELADNLNIDNLDLIESTHTELTRLRRETKMEAVKAAKEKASYMLQAIGERAGKSVFIKEIENARTGRITLDGVESNEMSNNISTRVAYSAAPDTLTFTQIKLRYEILARFEIE